MNCLRRRPASIVFVLAAILALAPSCKRWRARRGARSVTLHPTRPTARPSPPRPRPQPARGPALDHTRWIAAGGGAVPEINQLSLAMDLGLAREVFGADTGLVLFGSGPGAFVQVLDEQPPAPTLRLRLGELFAPRLAREAHYEPAQLVIHGDATQRNVLELLRISATVGRGPLVFYVAAHGDVGETAEQNRIALWGGADITPESLATMLDRVGTHRPIRMVITTCFSGGFSEVMYRGAHQANGLGASPRCGLFSTTWDRQASGCDPDPDRRVHEGYGVHFLNALRLRDREGNTLSLRDLDLDGDGHVGFLEAHARVRIVGESIDVPTTTSERWLRATAPTEGARLAVALPEDDAVIRGLGLELHLEPTMENARRERDALEHRLRDLESRLEPLTERLEQATETVSAMFLARWPVLDDPWHPAWEGTVARDQAELEALFADDPSVRDLEATRAQQARAEDAIGELEVDLARHERLVRALEDRELAERLHARGGAAWATFEALLACERGAMQ